MEWILEHWQLVLSVLAVAMAIVYAIAKGEALTLAAQTFALVVALARQYLAAIPESEFDQWAAAIWRALPSWMRLFISAAAIKSWLLAWRDKLVAATNLADESPAPGLIEHIDDEVEAFLER